MKMRLQFRLLGLIALLVVLLSVSCSTALEEEEKDLTPPGDVSNLEIMENDSSVLLKWKNPSDKDFCKVIITFTTSKQNTSQNIIINAQRGDVAEYNIYNLTNNEEYTFKLFTIDENGNKSKGVSITATPKAPVDLTPPAEVTNLLMEAGDGLVKLSWLNPTDDDFSYVEISFSPSENNITQPIIRQGIKGKTDSITLEGLRNGIEYVVTVISVDDSGNKTKGVIIKTIPKEPDKIPPNEVSNLSAIAKHKKVILSWTNPNDEDFSFIEISSIPANGTLSEPKILTKNSNTFVVDNLLNDVDYTFTIKTIDLNNNISQGVSISSTPITSTISLDVTMPNDSNGNIILTNDVAPIHVKVTSSESIRIVFWISGFISENTAVDIDRIVVMADDISLCYTYSDSIFSSYSYSELNLSDDFTAELYVSENGWYTIFAINEDGIFVYKSVEVKTIDKTPPKSVKNVSMECDGKYATLYWDNPITESIYDSPLKNLVVSYVFNDDYTDPDNGSVIIDVQTECSIKIPSGKTENDYMRFRISPVDELGNEFPSRFDQDDMYIVWCCDCLVYPSLSYSWNFSQGFGEIEMNERVINKLTRRRKLIVLSYRSSFFRELEKKSIDIDLDLSHLRYELVAINDPYNGHEDVSPHSFENSLYLRTVKLPDTIQLIGANAFKGCENLTSINIPDGVTTIGKEAFKDCIGLTKIEIPQSVTSIGTRAFSGCTGLSSITIPPILKIGDVFSDCIGLTSVTISQGVKELHGTFSGCIGIKQIIIPQSVTTIGWNTFAGCKNLSKLVIPEGVKIIDYFAFKDCTSLTSVTIPESVSEICSNCFMGCTKLTAVNMCNIKRKWYFKNIVGDVESKEKYHCFSNNGSMNIYYFTGRVENTLGSTTSFYTDE